MVEVDFGQDMEQYEDFDESVQLDESKMAMMYLSGDGGDTDFYK